ncbi:MAG: hypothetical protein R3E84_01500 [Pseudomonadales bacterium]
MARFTEHDALVIVTDGAALAATAADLLAHTAAAERWVKKHSKRCRKTPVRWPAPWNC